MERNLRKPGFINKEAKLSFLGKCKIEYRQKRIVVKILLLLLILGILVGTISLFINQKRYGLPSKESISSKLAYGKGISFVEYHGDKKVFSVSIDSFSVERAKLGPFAIGPLQIAQLNKVNVDLYLNESRSKLDGKKVGEDEPKSKPGLENPGEKGLKEKIPNFENPISNIKKNLPPQLKKIRGFKLRDISFNLWENGKRVFSISSDTATVDRKTGDLIFEGHATMDGGENGNLISHRIKWSRKTNLFSIKDQYILTKGQKRMQGSEIETDYLFRRVNDHFQTNKPR